MENPSPEAGVSRQKYKQKITAPYRMDMGMEAVRFTVGLWKMKMINDLVDNVYVLNLKRDRFKYDILARKLRELEIKHERFIAVDGYSKDFNPKLYGTGHGSVHRSPGSVACLISHINILEDAIDKNYKKILMLQDDIYFHKNFKKLLKKLAPKIKKSDGFYLGATESDEKQVERLRSRKHWRAGAIYKPSSKTSGLFAMILSSRVFEDALKYMRCYFFPDDVCVNALLRGWNAAFKDSSFVAYPNLIIPDTSKSRTWAGNKRQKRPMEIYSAKVGWDIENYDLSERYYKK